mmetsp:Transcript_25837/g.46950  ORF Transcript_25837/g.46950 Transcript_25837/m.46950 type:complete len:240 (-) Transcript_25837:1517-2236(-)
MAPSAPRPGHRVEMLIGMHLCPRAVLAAPLAGEQISHPLHAQWSRLPSVRRPRARRWRNPARLHERPKRIGRQKTSLGILGRICPWMARSPLRRGTRRAARQTSSRQTSTDLTSRSFQKGMTKLLQGKIQISHRMMERYRLMMKSHKIMLMSSLLMMNSRPTSSQKRIKRSKRALKRSSPSLKRMSIPTLTVGTQKIFRLRRMNSLHGMLRPRIFQMRQRKRRMRVRRPCARKTCRWRR